MTARTILELTPSPLERVESDIAVAGFFTDERPLRGGVARADWRLCGGLSKRIERGDLLGKSGEALLIGCGRALRSPRLLVVGLGDRQDFDLVRLSDEMSSAMRRCVGLRCAHIAISPLGVAADDVPRHAPALIAGVREASLESEANLWIHLCIQGPEIPGVHRAIAEACKAARADEVEIRVPEAASRMPASQPARSTTQAPARPST
jgi:Cytosol aminopeptidase family, N-terminal domain